MGPGERGSGEHSVHYEERAARDADQDQTGKGLWKFMWELQNTRKYTKLAAKRVVKIQQISLDVRSKWHSSEITCAIINLVIKILQKIQNLGWFWDHHRKIVWNSTTKLRFLIDPGKK